MRPTEGTFRHNGDRLMCRIIHNRQTLDDSAVRTAVKHKIHGPRFIRRVRPYQRLTRPHGHLLAGAAPQL